MAREVYQKSSRNAFYLTLIAALCVMGIYSFNTLKVKRESYNCLDDYSFNENTGCCYKASVAAVSFQSALADCQNDDGDLVSIHSDYENNYVVELQKTALKKYRDTVSFYYGVIGEVWLGLELNDESNEWKWTDGSAMDYGNWRETEPSNTDEKKLAALSLIPKLHHGEPKSNMWNSADERTPRMYTCKMKAKTEHRVERTMEPCPSDYVYLAFTNSCYKLNKTPVTFRNAEINCQADGAHLTSIHSRAENLVVSGLYHTQSTSDRAWIGIYYKGGERHWTDNSTIPFTRWATRNDSIEGHNLYAYIQKFDTLWRLAFTGQAQSICKKTAAFSVPAQKTPSRTCSDYYTYFEETGKCYKVFPPSTIQNATQTCSSTGSNLTSIHSAAENLFLIGLSIRHRKGTNLDDIWVGMSSEDGGYQWNDGSSGNYVNWAIGQPTDGATGVYISLKDGKWIGDGSGEKKRAFVCKKNN